MQVTKIRNDKEAWVISCIGKERRRGAGVIRPVLAWQTQKERGHRAYSPCNEVEDFALQQPHKMICNKASVN